MLRDILSSLSGAKIDSNNALVQDLKMAFIPTSIFSARVCNSIFVRFFSDNIIYLGIIPSIPNLVVILCGCS